MFNYFYYKPNILPTFPLLSRPRFPAADQLQGHSRRLLPADDGEACARKAGQRPCVQGQSSTMDVGHEVLPGDGGAVRCVQFSRANKKNREEASPVMVI